MHMNIKARDKKFLGRGFSPEDLHMTGSKDSYVIDARGKQHTDFLMGWCVGNIGWGNKEVRKRIAKFTGPEYVNPGFYYEPWVELSELLAKITPGKLTKSFRATGGTEAVEIALQAAMAHTKRHKFVSIEGGYHGHSLAALSIGASEYGAWYKKFLPPSHKLKFPLDDRAADDLEQVLRTKEVAALIMEPIVCNVGVGIPTKEFMRRAQVLCKKYGTLFIADEVACGFGRTGKLFASEHYGLKPDILCLAKGLTGGYGALGATIMTDEVAKSMAFEFSFYSTFGWQPLAVEATLANLGYLTKHWGKIESNVKQMEKYFRDRLSAMPFKSPAIIRIKGLAIGIEFEKAGYAVELSDKARKKGLPFAPFTDRIIVFFPALNISKKVAKQGLDILESVI
ncbi:MAG: aspartate aminotransferase family protein [Candidatus Vogelbacteria bacterium CG10_big_fil_rev_8_21_14_0_10_51_16]|uniref:Aspartate aminotransferase family protein n=1 Tax=Candidatus Vogelbacteria bacterium CG10_big_fil_rev_8_21_14_0_10_51_16 TaxID=1975045 RepID=A0A2H0RE94_9BACT|nr:MAG: aspartate aminotransferase family protein [Candidatus Vogelbacteria bacterium CG10_big_fil_rev_8_21_14_0_10_51_16]